MMDPVAILLIVIGIGLLLLFLGLPIFVTFAFIGCLLFATYAHWPLATAPSIMFHEIDKVLLLACPFFVFAGNAMVFGKTSVVLVDVMRRIFGRFPGGLAITAVASSAFFGAITGSSSATVAAIATILLPHMDEAGYNRSFSTGLLACSGTLGNIIPPSIVLILYGDVGETSVAKLFAGGLFSGLLIALFMIIVVVIICKRQGFREPETAVSIEGWGKLLLRAAPALFMPVLILGGIYGGIFTPTEAAAVSCIYALLVGFLVYKGLTWQGVKESLRKTIGVVGMLYPLIGTAILMNKMFIRAEFPLIVTKFVAEAGLGPAAFLGMAFVLVLGLGCILEGVPLIYVCVPLLLPTVLALGISPVHFGVIFCALVLIGQITPPVGIILYVTSSITKEPSESVIRGALPFLAAMTVATIIIIYVPAISLWLPSII